MRAKQRSRFVPTFVIFFILLVFCMEAPAAQGEKFPTKPIEILVPYPPGSAVDFMSRLIGDVGPKYLQQPFVVVNKTGANGSIAAAEVISSKPDGYKILMTSNIFFATTVKTQKVPFNPEDLVPIACFFEYKEGILVRSDAPWKTVPELVEYARKNPNKLKVAHTGKGTAAHLPLMEIFKGTEIIEIPTKGSAERIPALLGGHVDVAVLTYQPTKAHIRAGKMRLLAVFNDRRYPDLPDVPSLTDLGHAQAAKIKATNGLFVHKNVPDEIKTLLVETSKKIYEDPQFKKGLSNFGEEVVFGGPDYMKKSIEDAKEVGIPFVKKLGLYVEQ
jgi:tripartite-type tricarboxylate transporter receptor subunit TctC